MKKENMVRILCLFILFSFFSWTSCRTLLKGQLDIKRIRLQEQTKKIKAVHIVCQPKKEKIKQEQNTLNYSYFNIDIIVPGNKMASTNMQEFLEEEMKLEESNKKKIKAISTQNKEYQIDKDIKVIYQNHKIISFSSVLMGQIDQQSIHKKNVFSLNINTGTKITYRDITSNTKQLKQRIKEYIIKEIKQQNIDYVLDKIKIEKEIDKENFYLDASFLILVLHDSDTSGYINKNIMIKIPYEIIEDLLIEKYI